MDVEEPGWLMGHQELFARRARGNTCLSALQSMEGLDSRATNHGKGCGGVMRVAPVGMFSRTAIEAQFECDADYCFRLGASLAGITHGHPTGRLAAGAFAVIILRLLQGATPPVAIGEAKPLLRSEYDYEETLAAIERAERIAASSLPTERAIAELGEGWVAEEALAIAPYCALTSRDFESGVIAAVNHDGDSDSTGSMAGNLLGAIHGDEAIPKRWLEGLELRGPIGEIAEDLLAYPEWNIGEYVEGPEPTFYQARYPGNQGDNPHPQPPGTRAAPPWPPWRARAPRGRARPRSSWLPAGSRPTRGLRRR
jgi:ADP-ribosylglycohydrolase